MPSHTVACAALCAALALATPAGAMPMGGAFSGHVDTQVPQVLGPGAVRVQQVARGRNAGPGTPFDGADVQWTEVVQLKNGQGTHEGTITFVMPTGTTVGTYSGLVSTDAQGRVTARGKFKHTSATGQFTGLKGGGTYTAAYSSQTDFTGDWKGNFKLPPQRSSNR
jgi:hypothetical protein